VLVWPGQFLLGEQRQSTEDQINVAAPASNFPKWARRGSYVVVRRLDQDVAAFYAFVCRGAARIGLSQETFAAMLVGRWPSGAPILRAPGGDNPALGDDDFANNHFVFDDDARPSSLSPIPGYPGDAYPQAAADFLGQVCPHVAHIRKVHPRDTATDMGKPADTFARLILRRGIPYGSQLVGVENPTPKLITAARGRPLRHRAHQDEMSGSRRPAEGISSRRASRRSATCWRRRTPFGSAVADRRVSGGTRKNPSRPISNLTFRIDYSTCVGKPRCSSHSSCHTGD
jgi:hypothetical protein